MATDHSQQGHKLPRDWTTKTDDDKTVKIDIGQAYYLFNLPTKLQCSYFH